MINYNNIKKTMINKKDIIKNKIRFNTQLIIKGIIIKKICYKARIEFKLNENEINIQEKIKDRILHKFILILATAIIFYTTGVPLCAWNPLITPTISEKTEDFLIAATMGSMGLVFLGMLLSFVISKGVNSSFFKNMGNVGESNEEKLMGGIMNKLETLEKNQIILEKVIMDTKVELCSGIMNYFNSSNEANNIAFTHIVKQVDLVGATLDKLADKIEMDMNNLSQSGGLNERLESQLREFRELFTSQRNSNNEELNDITAKLAETAAGFQAQDSKWLENNKDLVASIELLKKLANKEEKEFADQVESLGHLTPPNSTDISTPGTGIWGQSYYSGSKNLKTDTEERLRKYQLNVDYMSGQGAFSSYSEEDLVFEDKPLNTGLFRNSGRTLRSNVRSAIKDNSEEKASRLSEATAGLKQGVYDIRLEIPDGTIISINKINKETGFIAKAIDTTMENPQFFMSAIGGLASLLKGLNKAKVEPDLLSKAKSIYDIVSGS